MRSMHFSSSESIRSWLANHKMTSSGLFSVQENGQHRSGSPALVFCWMIWTMLRRKELGRGGHEHNVSRVAHQDRLDLLPLPKNCAALIYFATTRLLP